VLHRAKLVQRILEHSSDILKISDKNAVLILGIKGSKESLEHAKLTRSISLNELLKLIVGMRSLLPRTPVRNWTSATVRIGTRTEA
jgi:hypothetical protein